MEEIQVLVEVRILSLRHLQGARDDGAHGQGAPGQQARCLQREGNSPGEPKEDMHQK